MISTVDREARTATRPSPAGSTATRATLRWIPTARSSTPPGQGDARQRWRRDRRAELIEDLLGDELRRRRARTTSGPSLRGLGIRRRRVPVHSRRQRDRLPLQDPGPLAAARRPLPEGPLPRQPHRGHRHVPELGEGAHPTGPGRVRHRLLRGGVHHLPAAGPVHQFCGRSHHSDQQARGRAGPGSAAPGGRWLAGGTERPGPRSSASSRTSSVASTAAAGPESAGPLASTPTSDCSPLRPTSPGRPCLACGLRRAVGRSDDEAAVVSGAMRTTTAFTLAASVNSTNSLNRCHTSAKGAFHHAFSPSYIPSFNTSQPRATIAPQGA